jgi:signal peptidase I
MDFDLEFWLVIASAVTGSIWLIYALLFKRKNIRRHEPLIVEYSASFFPVLVIVLILRSFIAEPFRIPSGSMIPTLEVGDFILVNKFSYGIRLPVIHTKIIDVDKPKRGDVAVFRYPVDGETDYIKRVIGLPGDKIRWENKRLFINDEEVQASANGSFDAIDKHNRVQKTSLFLETLGDVTHDIIIVPDARGVVGHTTVPEGHYFMMGDNRDNSSDSRFWGFVPEENLVGKALFVWMHLSIGGDGFKPSRIGEGIK